MGEAKEDILLCGPSNSGMTDPAHCSALALVQTTGAFLNCYAEDGTCPIDYSTSTVMVYLLSRMEKDVGDRFLEVERGLMGAHPST